jgi:AcrR family transcriptional regulator/DNA-binding MarR family transcriptional regulator
VSSGDDVDEAQRTKILEALAEVMAERGAGGSVSVADVIVRAGVSAGAFHETFADKEACLLEAFELAVRRARRPVTAAYDSQLRWLDSIKAALVAFLGFLEHEPALGRLLVVYSMSGGERVLLCRAALLRELAEVVDRGRHEGPPGRQQPPEVIAEGVVGAVLAVLQNRLVADPSTSVMDLYGSLVSIVVLPYLGAGAARRELSRPAPRLRTATGVEPSGVLALAQNGMRFTYRTTRVLGAIGDFPGGSNREVADRAGIVDQGQVSKLLSRLHQRGLIERIGTGRAARGAPNAWRLSERGEAALREAHAMSVASRS